MAGIELDSDIEKVTAELVRELEEYLQQIEEGNRFLNQTNVASRALSLVRRIPRRTNLEDPQSVVPPDFLCPISGKIMSEPVYFCAKPVFDKISIQKWESREVLSSSFSYTPNDQLRESIAEWGKDRLKSSLVRLSSSSLTDIKEAAKEIRQLTENSNDQQLTDQQLTENSNDTLAVFWENDSIEIFFTALFTGHINKHPDLLEDLIAVVFNLSLDNRYRKIFQEMPNVAHLLIRSLSHGTIVSRRTAAATISSIIRTDESNLQRYGANGVFKGLIGLLKEKDNLATKEASRAMWNLCFHRPIDRDWAIEDDVPRFIMEEISEISECVVYGELLAVIFILLLRDPNVAEQLGGNEGARVLLNVMEKEGNIEEVKELCATILRMQSEYDNEIVKMIKEDDVLLKKIYEFSGTARAKKEVDKIRLLTEKFNISHTLERGKDD